MDSAPNPAGLWRLAPSEWLYAAAVISACGLLAVLAGKDAGWDFLNYHWYDAYALLHGRLGFDVAVAHQATYFNPLIHVPFYLLATLTSSAIALFYLGALQGLNVIPLYWMGRSTLSPGTPRWVLMVLPLIGMAGSTAISMVRKTSYDQSLLSALVLGGLAMVVMGRARLESGGRAGVALSASAGLLVGIAVGLKPAEGPYGIGIALALLVPQGTARVRLMRLVAGAAGGVAGIFIAGGAWFLMLAHYSGNPLFPFFNSLWRSPLIGQGSFLDARFIPHGWQEIVSFPISFFLNYRVADDVPFRDLRIPLLYCLIPLSCVLWVWTRRPRSDLVRPRAAVILFVFCAASYAAWLHELAVYRYIVALEILAPLALVAAIGLMPLATRARIGLLCLLLLASAAMGHYAPGPFARLGNPYVQVSPVVIPRPDRTMILMSGFEPMAYLVPSFPPQIPVLRIQGYLVGPDDDSGLTATMRSRVGSFEGDLYLLFVPLELTAAQRAVADYGLRIDLAGCQRLRSNLDGPYDFCPLTRG